MHSRGLLRFCSRHECRRRTPCYARCSSRLRCTVVELLPSEATNSRIQRKEGKALSLTIRSQSPRSTRPVETRETLLPQPISSGPARLAIHTGSQFACLEFANLRRDLLLLANLASRFDSNLSSSRTMKNWSEAELSLPR